MAAGEHEAVAAEPLVVGRVVAHDLLEEQVRQRRQAHRGAGVAVARLLHGVGGQQPDGVDGADVERAPARRVRDRQGELRVAAAVRALRRFGGVGGAIKSSWSVGRAASGAPAIPDPEPPGCLAGSPGSGVQTWALACER